jgi:hypothetical protein
MGRSGLMQFTPIIAGRKLRHMHRRPLRKHRMLRHKQERRHRMPLHKQERTRRHMLAHKPLL